MPKEEFQPIELEEFVQQTLEKIEKATGVSQGKRGLGGTIKFEISVIKTLKGEGGVKIYVAGGSGGYQKESIAKISFEVHPQRPEPKEPMRLKPYSENYY